MAKNKKLLYHVPNNHHMWGDEDCDWEGIYAAERFIGKNLTRWGRIGTHIKEKYGTIRNSTYFYTGGFFSLLYPGYVSTWILEHAFGPKLGGLLQKLESYLYPNTPRWVKILIQKYQFFIYKFVYKKAFKKWPHLWIEIAEDSHLELLGIDPRTFYTTLGSDDYQN